MHKVTLQNDHLVYVYQNPSRGGGGKYQRDQLKDYFNHLGALAG